MHKAKSDFARVAVVQAEPVWLDLEGTVGKTCGLIQEAAVGGAKLIAFPECWIPGYPSWIWSRPVDPEMTLLYAKNAIALESPQMKRIQNSAAEHQIVVVLSFTKTRNHSLYISQATISSDGTILMARSKIKATHMERTIFGDAGAECLNTVVDTPAGRVGMLSCWEHTQPLLKYFAYSQNEQIHVAAWPPVWEKTGGELWSVSREGVEALSRTYAIESQSFVLHSTAVLSQSGIDRMRTEGSILMGKPGGGASAIFGPDGVKLSDDLPETVEGLIYADLNLDDIIHSRSFLHLCGHYSRPDLLWLGVDKDVENHVRVKEN
ncbi:aliphatic nitrilase [Stachybotrys elegans]|uniref:nitrilase n=1 Tax=Stachybotrys elegans TaxID=80388 RepID=A0A8K0T7S1_9HYPO|nr:aliphatic nitrilase [Stachybotrys elegans]